jgi:alpha-galactosidase
MALASFLLLVLIKKGYFYFLIQGWNTWCTLGPCGRDYCDEDEIKAMADVIVSSGLKDLGYNYVNLDDCKKSRVAR